MNQYRPGIEVRPPAAESRQSVETTLFEVQVKLFRAGVERTDKPVPTRHPLPFRPPDELKPKP